MDYRVLESIGDFCQEARSLSEIAEHLGLGDRYKMKKKYIDPILGKIMGVAQKTKVNYHKKQK